MATEEWLEAARNYSRMPESARAEYWGRLTPDQQTALSEALAATVQAPVSPVVTAPANVTASPPPRSGCGGPIAAGCMGVVLGVLLTIGIEVAVVMMGFGAVGDALKKYTGDSFKTTNSAPSSDEYPAELGINPNDPVHSTHEQLIRYCGTDKEPRYKVVADACASERANGKAH